MVDEIILIILGSTLIGTLEFGVYQAGEGYYSEDRYLIFRKTLEWVFRIGLGISLTFGFREWISINEFWLFVCGYHLMSSIFTKAIFYQLKRSVNREDYFHALCHSINGLFYISRNPIIDLYAFVRILLFVLGYIMLNYEYY